jgi:hypothetical protein
MARIAAVVKLRTGYANFVNLKSAYEEARENADRMAMYLSADQVPSGRLRTTLPGSLPTQRSEILPPERLLRDG